MESSRVQLLFWLVYKQRRGQPSPPLVVESRCLSAEPELRISEPAARSHFVLRTTRGQASLPHRGACGTRFVRENRSVRKVGAVEAPLSIRLLTTPFGRSRARRTNASVHAAGGWCGTVAHERCACAAAGRTTLASSLGPFAAPRFVRRKRVATCGAKSILDGRGGLLPLKEHAPAGWSRSAMHRCSDHVAPRRRTVDPIMVSCSIPCVTFSKA